MKASLTPLRIILALIGALALVNIGTALHQLRVQQPAPSTPAVVLTLLFATLSLTDGLMLLFSAWQLERLLAKARTFLRFAILFRFALLLVERAPIALAGDYLSISLILLWSGVTFHLIKTVDRLSAEANTPE